MTEREETDAEALARHDADAEAEFDRLDLAAESHPHHDDCAIDECSVCGFRDCPEPEMDSAHYWKDGCPTCDGPRAELERSLSAIWGPT